MTAYKKGERKHPTMKGVAYSLSDQDMADVREGHKVLDIAGGTGDLALAFSRKAGKSGQVVHTDINEAMLRTHCQTSGWSLTEQDPLQQHRAHHD